MNSSKGDWFVKAADRVKAIIFLEAAFAADFSKQNTYSRAVFLFSCGIRDSRYYLRGCP